MPTSARDEWQLRAQDIKIAKNADGSDKVLGAGGFGTVRISLKMMQDAWQSAQSHHASAVHECEYRLSSSAVQARCEVQMRGW